VHKVRQSETYKKIANFCHARKTNRALEEEVNIFVGELPHDGGFYAVKIVSLDVLLIKVILIGFFSSKNKWR
jgi:hypothetical protein